MSGAAVLKSLHVNLCVSDIELSTLGFRASIPLLCFVLVNIRGRRSCHFQSPIQSWNVGRHIICCDQWRFENRCGLRVYTIFRVFKENLCQFIWLLIELPKNPWTILISVISLANGYRANTVLPQHTPVIAYNVYSQVSRRLTAI